VSQKRSFLGELFTHFSGVILVFVSFRLYSSQTCIGIYRIPKASQRSRRNLSLKSKKIIRNEDNLRNQGDLPNNTLVEQALFQDVCSFVSTTQHACMKYASKRFRADACKKKIEVSMSRLDTDV